jgi:hypothetical protein
MTDRDATELLAACSTTTRRDRAQVALDSLELATEAHRAAVLQWRRGILLACVALGVWTGANVAATGIVVWMARWAALQR